MAIRRIVLEADPEVLAERGLRLSDAEHDEVALELGLRVLQALNSDVGAAEMIALKERCLVSLVAQGGGQ